MQRDNYMEGRERRRNRKNRRRRKIFGMIFLFLLLLVLFGYSTRISDITVVGNTRYTEEELLSMVFSGNEDRNTFYALYRNQFGKREDIPFVEKYSVKVTGLHSAQIIVYEKSLAGCIEYMGSYMYFDREGTIVESSRELEPQIPLVTGIKFQSIVMYEKLPVEDDTVFAEILNLSQLLGQFQLFAERMDFDSENKVTLIMGDIRVVLGDADHMAGKVKELHDMYPELSGRSGTVYLDEYKPDVKNPSYPFVPDGGGAP
ncbi:MAG: cell division protein FtsQ [Lachnospiraceae bacterium]|nr:cell division protein FtsQ [Lachnospiraceae bacterium]